MKFILPKLQISEALKFPYKSHRWLYRLGGLLGIQLAPQFIMMIGLTIVMLGALALGENGGDEFGFLGVLGMAIGALILFPLMFASTFYIMGYFLVAARNRYNGKGKDEILPAHGFVWGRIKLGIAQWLSTMLFSFPIMLVLTAVIGAAIFLIIGSGVALSEGSEDAAAILVILAVIVGYFLLFLLMIVLMALFGAYYSALGYVYVSHENPIKTMFNIFYVAKLAYRYFSIFVIYILAYTGLSMAVSTAMMIITMPLQFIFAFLGAFLPVLQLVGYLPMYAATIYLSASAAYSLGEVYKQVYDLENPQSEINK